MSLSDDVASLKVGVHKLAIAIEELAIRKYVQGEIDISKLPWFTPQYVPGDSIKLSGSRLPTATVYSDNNEVIASPTPSFLNTSDNSLGAPKVFDKMLEPYSCSNQLKNVATHFSGTQTPTAANLNLPCDKDANLTMVVGQLASLNAFEKDTNHGGDSQRYANGVVRVNSQCLTPNFGVDGKLSDVHEHLSDCKLIPKPQLQSAHKVLDEVPLPTFIREMAEAAKITGLDSAQDDCDTIYEDSYDSLAYKQIFAKLGTLDGPYLWDLVILGASQARFSKLQSLVHMGSQTADQLLLADEHYDGNLTKCSLLQFGEVDIDSSLVASHSSSNEDIVMVNNGCLCCTVRGDLVKMLLKLAREKRDKFDHIIIETTGLAKPGPVIETFCSDEEVSRHVKLDGVVTLVDSKHAMKRLSETKKRFIVNESVEQVAYADRIILNKIDLVNEAELEELTLKIKHINGIAQIKYAKYGNVDLDFVLGVGGYDLDRVESAVKLNDSHCTDHDHEHKVDHDHPKGHHHDHAHDSAVSSVSIVSEKTIDLDELDDWLERLIEEKGEDLYRYKGILSVSGSDARYVLQGVHTMLDGCPGKTWGPDEKRISKLVFIGSHLDETALRKGFKGCIVQ